MSGLPGIASVAELGGVLKNSIPVANPETDLDADADNTNRECTAAATHTVPRAIASCLGHATTPADPTGFVHDANWGNLPNVKPTVVKGGTGIYDYTFPVSVTDELGVSHTLNFRRAHAQCECVGGVLYVAVAEVTGPNTVRVRTFLGSTSAANDAVGIVQTVWVY